MVIIQILTPFTDNYFPPTLTERISSSVESNCVSIITPKTIYSQLDAITIPSSQIVLIYDQVILTPQIILLNIHVAIFILSTYQITIKYPSPLVGRALTRPAKQIGGGATYSNKAVIDLTNLPDTAQPSSETLYYPQETHQKGILQVGVYLTTKCPWQPRQSLPIRRGDHPIEHLIPQESFPMIQIAAQQNRDDVLMFLADFPAETVTTTCFRELISHGEMTRDTILNTFLAVLCASHNLTYLSTFFVHLLRRDRSWSQLTSWFAPTLELQTYSTPYQNTTQPILIPCHVLGAHWVGIVRRVVHGTVYFLYADDLNHTATELELQTLLKTHSPPSFYPDNAIWIHCNSVTFRPHSNECGPRTLFALAAMALHPEPSPDILVPFMSPNIAQILRTWIGAALLTGQVSMPSWNTPQPRNIPSSTSVPTYLFPWADAHHLEVEHSKRQCGKPRRPKPQLPLPPLKTATAQWQGNTQKLNLPTIQSNRLKSGIQLTVSIRTYSERSQRSTQEPKRDPSGPEGTARTLQATDQRPTVRSQTPALR
jgi:hypothetical protein